MCTESKRCAKSQGGFLNERHHNNKWTKRQENCCLLSFAALVCSHPVVAGALWEHWCVGTSSINVGVRRSAHSTEHMQSSGPCRNRCNCQSCSTMQRKRTSGRCLHCDKTYEIKMHNFYKSWHCGQIKHANRSCVV